jgi:hypothetical protein
LLEECCAGDAPVPRIFALGAYVEGWIVVPRTQEIAIVEHGWCTSPEAGIVDPSIVLIEKREQPVFYFPGFEFAGSSVAQHIAGKTVPLVCNAQYGRDGMWGIRDINAATNRHGCAHKIWRESGTFLRQTAIHVSTRDTKRGLTIIKAS